MAFKSDTVDQGQFSRMYQKKLSCSQHGNRFTYKCNYQYCSSPYMCNSMTCLENHFHQENEGKLVISKIDTTEYYKKFGELERVMTKEDFSTQAKQLKAFIDELKLSMVSIYKDYRELHSRKDLFLAEVNKPFEPAMMDKVDETINIGHNLRKAIDTLKSKVNLNLAGTGINQPQREENGSIKQNGTHSPSFNGKQENSKKINNQNGAQKGYEHGEVIMDKNQRQNSLNISIDLQGESESSNFNTLSQSKPLNMLNNEPKFVPLFLKNQPSKDSFEELFETANKIKPDDNVEGLGPQKVNNFKQLLKSINGNSIQSLANGSTSPQRQQNPETDTGSNQLNQQSQKIVIRQDSSSHQNLKIYERDFLLKKQLTIFLEQRIKSFSWGLCQEIYSSHMPSRSVDKFHQLLEGKKCLLFIFIGENRILGSFYPSRYPRLVEKLRNDPNSFLFVSNNEQSKILEYRAVPCEFHMSVSDKLYICHGNTPSYADGIRTIQKNFNELNFYLPSVSFKYCPDDGKMEDAEGKNLSGFLKVKEFFVLQVSGVEPTSIDLN